MLATTQSRVLPRDAHQRQVALVQIAHRRHERDAIGPVEPLAQRLGRLDHFHRCTSVSARVAVRPARD